MQDNTDKSGNLMPKVAFSLNALPPDSNLSCVGNWHAENAASIVSSNSYVALHGMPLYRWRQF